MEYWACIEVFVLSERGDTKETFPAKLVGRVVVVERPRTLYKEGFEYRGAAKAALQYIKSLPGKRYRAFLITPNNTQVEVDLETVSREGLEIW